MLREFLIKLQSFLVDGDEVSAYRSMVPSRVSIRYKKDNDTYIAFVNVVDGEKIKGLLITEGKTIEELQKNLNQLIYMNAKIPEKIRPYYGNMFTFPIVDGLQKAGELTLVKV